MRGDGYPAWLGGNTGNVGGSGKYPEELTPVVPDSGVSRQNQASEVKFSG
jgi:hypothetical protein